jgi:Fe-S-cluster containining protein
MSDRVNVPCAGCTACCRTAGTKYGGVFLRETDDSTQYVHHWAYHPLTGVYGREIDVTKDGDCVYLDGNGCTIYDRAPEACRIFDCRQLLQFSAAHLTATLRAGFLTQDVIDAAKQRRTQ